MKMTVKPSSKSGKKYMAIFEKKNGRTKTTHFGASGMDDYTLTGDKNARERYRSRHRKDLQTNDPTRAGYLSYYLLWGNSSSLRKNISTYKKRFNLT
jgi:hypothetical protein